MKRKRKKTIFFTILLSGTIIVFGLGLKYIPFNKIISIRSSSETGFTNQQQNSRQAPHSIFFDFEVTPGKNTPDGLYKGLGHSGIYSSKAFGKDSYSTPIKRTIGEIGIENLKTVGWSAWIYVFPTSKEIKATLVLVVSNPLGVNVLWKGIGLSGPGIPQGKWFKISNEIDLSGVSFKPDYNVQIYLWNTSSTDILVDDYYIVFGGSAECRGDSTLVDMTKKIPFAARFNFPPFKTVFLEKEEIHNQNSSFLINGQTIKEGEMTPGNKIIGGRFLNTTTGLDDILEVKKSGKPEIFTFCPEERQFKKVEVDLSTEAVPYFSSGFVVKGKFAHDRNEQVLIVSEKGFILGQFDQIKNTCSPGISLKTSFKILWKSTTLDINRNGFAKERIFYPGDFNGDQQTELLVVPGNGTWKLLRFVTGSDGNWKTIAEGSKDTVAEWNGYEFEFKISTGRFIPGLNQDVLLTVTKNKGNGQKTFSLCRFNSARSRFEPLFSPLHNHYGKTIGLDTLQIADDFLIGNFDGKGKTDIFRYNRDWRFDLKQIRFNDTTFQVLNNIDFNGFLKDHNPKYYEVLALVPGKFTNPAVTSLLVIGRNCKDIKFDGKDCQEYQNKSILPDFMSIYSLKQALKK